MLEVEVGEEVAAYRGKGKDPVLVVVTNTTDKYIDTRCENSKRSRQKARWRKINGVKTGSYHVSEDMKEKITDDPIVIKKLKAKLRREERRKEQYRRGCQSEVGLDGGSIAAVCKKRLKGREAGAPPLKITVVIRVEEDLGSEQSESGRAPKGTHPPHPKCTVCGKPMYKTMIKGKHVKKTDPWVYCRNEECDLHGEKQSEKKLLVRKLKKLKKKSKSS